LRASPDPRILDSFAGGGGASTGIEIALGRSPDMAVNHNPAALALHAANHPQTLHLSENIYKVDPLDYVRGRHIGLAWFSPDCKHFSKAKGGKPVERNVRDLAWVIPGWVERIQDSGGSIDVVILENVEEFRDWGPLVETDKGLMPDPEARGQTFEKWCKTIRRLGGRLEWRELRACDFGAPTIRKRLFIIIRFDGGKIVWPKPTHGKPDDPDVVAGRKLPWRTAAEIIDWSLPCPSIFDTTAEVFEKHGLRAVRPLASATMSRVARGVDRYVLKSKRPFVVGLAHGDSGGRREYGIGEPLTTVHAGGNNQALVTPSIIRFNTGATGHDAREPLATVTANSFKKKPGVAAPLGVIAPVLSYAQQGGANRSVEDPAHTICASKKDQNAVIVPSLVGCGGRAGQSRPRGGDEPLATITAKADVCVTAAFLAQHNNDGRRIGGVNPGRPADEPLSTITSNPQQGVIAAHLMSMKGSARRDRPVDEPHATVLAEGQHSAFIAPHLMTMRNAQKPFSSPDEPTHTITAGGAGLTIVEAELRLQDDSPSEGSAGAPAAREANIVAPFLQSYYGTGDGQRLDEPQRTVTTKDRFGYVEGEAAAPPLSDAQLARARQVAFFLREHGFWDEREFVTVEIEAEVFTIVDIGMRMLTPRELFSAQGFPPDYIIDLEFNGRPLPKSDQIACCGNSVSPPMAAALVAANCPQLVAYMEAAE